MTHIPLVSLYSGAGGLDLGFLRGGFIPTFANDVDRLAPSSYAAVVKDQMRNLDLDPDDHRYVVKDVSDDYANALDTNEESVVVGGPPCQGFSRAGRMNPDDPRSRQVKRFVEAVTAIRPRAFVMENVRSLATSPRWTSVYDEVRRSADAGGYDTVTLILDAKDFGVPQSRARMFLIGARRGEGYALDRVISDDRSESVSVRSALAAMPVATPEQDWQRCTAAIVPAKRPVLRMSPFAGMLFNGQGRPLDLEQPALTISASLGGNHTPIIDENWLADSNEQAKSIFDYHAAVESGQEVRVPRSWRRLTLAEAAQLQSFPVETNWSGPLSGRFRHIGNAVPPLLAFEVAKRVRALLENSALESDQSMVSEGRAS